jgi:hypothetical protein
VNLESFRWHIFLSADEEGREQARREGEERERKRQDK